MKRAKGAIVAALAFIFCASVSDMVWADWVIGDVETVSPVFERVEGIRLAETVVGIDGGEEIVFGEESFSRAFAGALDFEDGAGRRLSFEDGDFTVDCGCAVLTEDGIPAAAGPLDGSVYTLAGAQVSFADERAYGAEKFPETVTVEYRTALVGGEYCTVERALETGGEIELVRASKFAPGKGRAGRAVLRAGSSLSGGALILRAGETFTVESGANFASEGVVGGENARIVIESGATVSAVGVDGTHFSAGKTYASENGVWTALELNGVFRDGVRFSLAVPVGVPRLIWVASE